MGLTLKQEKFCQAYIQTGNASEAYRQAYDTSKMKSETVNRNAFTLVNANTKIKARVEELRAPALQSAMLTLETHLAEMDRLARVAEENGNLAAAIRAQELRGKAAGLYEDRIRVTAQRAEDMDRDSLLRIAQGKA